MPTEKIFALGFFDGVHLGHQALLEECAALARELGIRTAAITFDRHPMAAFSGECPPLLTTAADRQRLLRRFGMEEVCVLPATLDVMSTPWQSFLEHLLAQGAAGFVCGYDFRFGHRGEGTAATLQAFCRERGLPCRILPEQTHGGIRISSTHIRRLIEAGDMEAAAEFLGHPHVLTGTVVAGRQLGRTMGIPTANLALPEQVVTPRFGVYACRCLVGERSWPAVTNVGTRPTVGGHHVTVEPWLLDFSGDLYGRELTLEFCKFLRPEQRFPSLDALKAAILENAAQTREFFEKS